MNPFLYYDLTLDRNEFKKYESIFLFQWRFEANMWMHQMHNWKRQSKNIYQMHVTEMEVEKQGCHHHPNKLYNYLLTIHLHRLIILFILLIIVCYIRLRVKNQFWICLIGNIKRKIKTGGPYGQTLIKPDQNLYLGNIRYLPVSSPYGFYLCKA